MPLSVILPDGTVTQPELGSGDPVDSFTQEITVAAEAIASGREAERLSGNLARQALRLCLAEIESVKTRKVDRARLIKVREESRSWTLTGTVMRDPVRNRSHDPAGCDPVCRPWRLSGRPRAREPPPHPLELLVVKLARGMGLLESLEQVSRGVRFFHVVNLFPHPIRLHESNQHQHHQNRQAHDNSTMAELNP